MNEELRRYGTDGRLAGILTMPGENRVTSKSRPVVIFITAGLVHKPGPHRLYVQLSRTLASNGYTCLRFDLSGIGESAPAPGEADAEQAAVNDVQQVMDELQEETGNRRFVLMGLCSGAEVAHRTAVIDNRVHGMIALDGYIQRNWKFYACHYLPRLLSARKWMSFLARKLERLKHGPTGQEPDAEQEALEFWRGPGPTLAQLEREFRELADRGVRQLQVFSGGSGDCSYAGQFKDVFGRVNFRDTLTVRFIREADHMYILSSDRRNLIRSIVRWIQNSFAAEPRPQTVPSRPQGRALGQQAATRAIFSTRSGNPADAGRRQFK